MTKVLDNGILISEEIVDRVALVEITIGGGETGNKDKFLVLKKEYDKCSETLETMLGFMDLDSPNLTIEELCGLFDACELKYLNWVV